MPPQRPKFTINRPIIFNYILKGALATDRPFKLANSVKKAPYFNCGLEQPWRLVISPPWLLEYSYKPSHSITSRLVMRSWGRKSVALTFCKIDFCMANWQWYSDRHSSTAKPNFRPGKISMLIPRIIALLPLRLCVRSETHQIFGFRFYRSGSLAAMLNMKNQWKNHSS